MPAVKLREPGNLQYFLKRDPKFHLKNRILDIYLEPKWPLVLIEKGIVLEGSTPKIEDKQVTGIYTNTPHAPSYPLSTTSSTLVFRPELQSLVESFLLYKTGGNWLTLAAIFQDPRPGAFGNCFTVVYSGFIVSFMSTGTVKQYQMECLTS